MNRLYCFIVFVAFKYASIVEKKGSMNQNKKELMTRNNRVVFGQQKFVNYLAEIL